ncbi:pyridoxamine 5'-phosphate oxidase family protein [Salinarimonas ramus]|uniref:Pyridoxamine 5'-phosphate oxidase family protein n=1 Tax=Salinarimonas ramus TaxID=690164 RepID=A0A917V8P9_9HYPH|nr:pyridoxamine 5'-phosphate oxidase family protein [Salinarimonas ramus]GGK49580.1 hypothetical protein GCM10011322_40760 [Salinarimonas ramus]
MDQIPSQPSPPASTRTSERKPAFARIRNAKRAVPERAAAYDLLDRSLYGHVGFVHEDRPMVIPMIYARDGDTLYLHGASKTRLVVLGRAAKLCLTVTHMDGIVVARSAFHHSMNYRGVVVHGTGRAVEGAEMDRALDLVTDHLLPGRTGEIRAMTAQERKATGVVALDVEEITMKVRTGPPIDDDEDLASNLWAGVVPILTRFGEPQPDAYTPAGAREPGSIAAAQEKFLPEPT